MSEKDKDSEKATPDKTVKESTEKKAPAKKSVAKKKASSKKKAVAQTATQAAAPTPSVDPNIRSIIEEMNSQRETRDKQISSLIEEVHQGFSTLSSNSSKQDVKHQKEMAGLYHSLENTFGHIKDSSTENEELNLNIFKSLSDSMMNDHEQTLVEIKEQGNVQDKKIQHMAKMLEQRTGRNRLIAVPGVIIAMVGIFYMFYVVSIMETAMSNMSANMLLIQKDVHSLSRSVVNITGRVGSMADDISTISQDTNSMGTNMGKLNGNVANMSTDLNVMSTDLNVLTHNVAPAMKGMRNMMPWSP